MASNETIVTAEPGRQELFITREFDAPRELVFRAFTEPELIAQWLGPRSLSVTIDVCESRSGGAWRFVHTDADGNSYGFHGVNHEVLPPERLIRTFEFEGMPESGHVVLEVARLEALPGNRTRVINQSVFLSVEDRDGMVQSGMEHGVRDSHNKLDELLARGF